jgi:hypothetical protein
MSDTQPRPKVARLSIAKAVEGLLEYGARKATVYQHPLLTVVATRRFKSRKGQRFTEIILTIGSPNYRNRLFVKDALKAGEPFPVKRVQLEWFPQKGGNTMPAKKKPKAKKAKKNCG